MAPGAEADRPQPALDITEALERLVGAGGSDLCLKAGNRPLIRVDGKLRWLDGTATELGANDTMEVLHEILPEAA